jgi:hypothetical protein
VPKKPRYRVASLLWRGAPWLARVAGEVAAYWSATLPFMGEPDIVEFGSVPGRRQWWRWAVTVAAVLSVVVSAAGSR